MSRFLSIHGNAYTRDPDYSALRGRVVGEFTVERHDARRNCRVLTTYEVIDFARPEPIRPADVDAQLAEETWEVGSALSTEETLSKSEARRARDALLLERVRAFLAGYGESSSRVIAQNVGADTQTVAHHLRKHTNVYVHLGGPRSLWGLVGVDYGLSPTLPQYVYVFRSALQQHGPMTVADLCRATGIMRGSATAGMAKFTAIFVKVGHTTRGRIMAAVWGLVGVHDHAVADETNQ